VADMLPILIRALVADADAELSDQCKSRGEASRVRALSLLDDEPMSCAFVKGNGWRQGQL
jgi:hypothetical protein